MDFKKILSTILGILKVDALSKNEQGKSTLTQEQEASLKEEFGEKFLSTFKKQLDAWDEGKQEKEKNSQLEDLQTKLQVKEDQIKNLQDVISIMSEESVVEKSITKTTSEAEKKNVNVVIPGGKLMQHPLFLAAKAAGAKELGKVQRLMSTIDVTELIQDDFFQNFISQGIIPFVHELSFGFETEKYMTIVNAADIYKAVKPSMTSVSQQFVDKWTPSGSAKFSPLSIPNRRHKLNVPIIPSDIEGWIMYLYQENLTPEQMPITKYIVNVLIKKQLMNDIELKMIGQGTYVALNPSAVVEGQAGQAPELSVDGFCTILEKLYDAGDSNVNWVSINPITVSNAEDELQKFVAALVGTPYAKVPMNLFVSPEIEYLYAKNIVKSRGVGIKDTVVDKNLYGSNLALVGLPSMIGSTTVFATPKANFVRLKHINNPDVLRTETRRYTIECFGEYWLAPGFVNKNEIWASAPGSDSGSGSGS